MAEPHAVLLERIQTRAARVGILGLGYVGLPLARAFAERGFPVLGFDIDAERVERLRQGDSPLGHVSAADLARMRQGGFEATDCFDRLDEPDALLLCVPTPLTPTREPDLAHVVRAAQAVAWRLRAGQLVVLESTTYPGTTRQVVLPLLEASGLKAGRDFWLAYCPEREDPGNTVFTTGTIPRVVGGLDPPALELAAALYGAVAPRIVPVSGPEAAEACKILENTYRAVNIALVNELKVLYDRMGIDIWEVIAAATTKPFGFQPFAPGPGLGGHCIPVDPFYLTWVARKHGLSTRLIEVAGEINTGMPAFVVGKVADALNERGKPLSGSQVLLLGMAYKKDVDDPRESPGLELWEQLTRKGAVVRYNDPHVPELPRSASAAIGTASQPLTAELLAAQDCVLIVTDHSVYDWPWVVAHSALVVDTRNATRGVNRHRERIVLA